MTAEGTYWGKPFLDLESRAIPLSGKEDILFSVEIMDYRDMKNLVLFELKNDMQEMSKDFELIFSKKSGIFPSSFFFLNDS